MIIYPWGVCVNRKDAAIMKPDNKKILHQLKIAKGQMEGIIKMIENGDRCANVLIQIAACDKVLKRSASLIMENSLLNCAKEAKKKDCRPFEKNLGELIKAFRTYL